MQAAHAAHQPKFGQAAAAVVGQAAAAVDGQAAAAGDESDADSCELPPLEPFDVDDNATGLIVEMEDTPPRKTLSHASSSVPCTQARGARFFQQSPTQVAWGMGLSLSWGGASGIQNRMR